VRAHVLNVSASARQSEGARDVDPPDRPQRDDKRPRVARGGVARAVRQRRSAAGITPVDLLDAREAFSRRMGPVVAEKVGVLPSVEIAPEHRAGNGASYSRKVSGTLAH
jgi:hypothetical protein